MRKDNRKFCASISVRNGEERTKLELSPAPLHGGPKGFYRVRLTRRWLDKEDGARTAFMKAPGRTRSRFWTTRDVGWSTSRWEESACSCRWKM